MSTATIMRDAYIAAETAVLLGQTVEIAGRRLSRANLEEIQAGRREWEKRVADEAAAAAGSRGPLRCSYAHFDGPYR